MPSREESGRGTRARVFIVDDHPIVRRGIADLVEAAPDLRVVGEAGDARSALAALEKGACDVAIVDIALGEGSGLELIKQLRAEGRGPKVLVLSMHDDRLYAERCIRAGASGYVNKAEAGEQVVEAIRRVLKGGIHVSAEVQERVLRGVARERRPVKDPVERLSDRELEVFARIGRGLSVKAIAQELGLSTKTVETHRANIKEKLGLKSGAELLAYAIRWEMERH